MMPEDVPAPKTPENSGQADARAFAIAHGIVDLLKRGFYSWLPFLLFWKLAGWSVAWSLAASLAAGYALEAGVKRLLAEEDTDS